MPASATTPLPAAGLAAALADASEQTFQSGSLVADRYRIRSFLARGGMGEVYEAQDQTLNVVVALKTLRPLAADDPGAQERLKREIQLARRVTHENVCRIFDVGYHQAGEHQISFLTMELLRGETLAARLRRDGRMATAVALPILRQVAAALGAAHKAEVVHRDFKSENVFLVDDSTEESGVRAVVADFGIARATVEDGSRLTGTGVIGTPAYMAPEQLEGGEIGPATDIYAFGLVAYEMVTGRLPFLGDTAIATAVKRLTSPPEPPRQFVPELEERWEAVILRCLERQPADRFASASAAVAALGSRELPAPTAIEPVALRARSLAADAALPGRPRERGKRWLLVALALAMALVATTTVLRVRGRQEAAQMIAGPVVARRVVAVLGFSNSTGRPEVAWLSTALAEMLTTELGSAKSLRVMPGELVARARVELGLADSADLDASGRAKLRSLLGADYFVVGGYTALGAGTGGRVRLDLRLLDAQGGEVLTSYGVDGTEAQLFDIVRRAGAVVRERLGATADAATGFWSSARWTPEATRLYAQGIAHLRAFEPRAAREVLERAVAADPESSLAHAALADAWGALGYQELAKAEAARAFELAAKLPVEEKLEIEGRYRDRTGEAARAAEIYAQLFETHPDDLEVGLRLAAAFATAGRGQEALLTLAELRKLPAAAAEDPRIALAEAMSAGALADFGRQRTAAAAAATAAAAKGAQLLVARARLAEGSAQRNLGDLAAAEATSREAAAIFASMGDRAGEADALWIVGTARFDRGDLPGAKALYDQALAVYREVGDQAGTARVLNSAAVAARQEGDLAGARSQYQTVLAICREIADQGGVAASLGNLGTVALQEGHLEAARQQFAESLELRRRLPDQAGLASALANMGAVLRRLGLLAEARQQLEESLALRRQSGQKIASAASLCGLGRVVLDLGDLAMARSSFAEALTLAREGGSKSVEALALAATGEVAVVSGDLSAGRVALEQSLTLRGAIGERLAAAESRLLLANVLLEEGQVSEALAAVRAARAEFVQLGATDLQLLAAVLEVRALNVQGEAVAARALVQATRALAERSQSPPARWALRIARAELDGESATGRARARADLVLVSREAKAAGFVGLSWEARLLAAEMAGAAGRVEFAAVVKETEAAGFLLLAGKARRAR